MCGIAGRINLNGKRITERELDSVSEKIKHRDPDDTGTFVSSDRLVGLP